MKRKRAIAVRLPSEQTLELCERAVSDLGWTITGQNETRLRAKLGMTLVYFPFYVTCEVDPDAGGRTTLYIQVETSGYGPLAGRKVSQKLDEIFTRVEMLVRRTASDERPQKLALDPIPKPSVTKQSVDLAELEQYADLHDQGVLSDDEFAALKRQWLQFLGA